MILFLQPQPTLTQLSRSSTTLLHMRSPAASTRYIFDPTSVGRYRQNSHHLYDIATSNAISWLPTSSSDHTKNDIITLLVGNEEQAMVVLKSNLVQHSEFFRAALTKKWAEGQTRIVKLPEEKPETMALYLMFIHGYGLPTEPIEDHSCQGKVYDVLTELYALGERLLDSTLRNATIREIVRFTTVQISTYPHEESINNIYNSTTATSPARRLLVDLYVQNGCETWVGVTLHLEFYELAKALMVECSISQESRRWHELCADDYLV
jgi:hypothetical protein